MGTWLQYVPVHPATLYRFSGYMRVEGITTDSGPRFQIYDAEAPSKLFLSTENLTGSSSWSPERLEFTTGPETRLLVVRLAGLQPQVRQLDCRNGLDRSDQLEVPRNEGYQEDRK
jgi:hypothetical protein